MKKQNIQLWRGAACLMVFTVHFGQRMAFTGTLRKLTDQGALGVYLFLIISGYLIAQSCRRYAGEQPGRYIANRMLRILPLYYVVIFYYFAVHVLVLRDIPSDPTGWGVLRYLFVLNSIVPPTGEYFWDNLGITWTIPFFVWMYAALPFLLRYVKTWLGSVVLLALSLKLFGNLWKLNGYLQILYYLPYFLEGVVIYHACREGKKGITAVGTCVLALCLYQAEGYETLFSSCFFVLLILATDGLRVETPVFLRLLDLSDRYSYTLYLAHGIVFIHLLDRGIPASPPARALTALAGSAVLTWVLNKFAEVPIQNRLRLLLDRKKQHP